MHLTLFTVKFTLTRLTTSLSVLMINFFFFSCHVTQLTLTAMMTLKLLPVTCPTCALSKKTPKQLNIHSKYTSTFQPKKQIHWNNIIQSRIPKVRLRNLTIHCIIDRIYGLVSPFVDVKRAARDRKRWRFQAAKLNRHATR